MTDKPRTRTELYLAAIAGEDVIPPEPLSREEQYLYKIAMGDRPGGSGGDDAPFELIETITVSEAVKEIERTAEPDGTPYNFRKLMIKDKLGGAQSARSGIEVYTNADDKAIGFIESLATAHIFFVEIINGREFCYYSDNSNNLNVKTDTYGYYECESITSLKMASNQNIPVGSTFEIYAVRK